MELRFSFSRLVVFSLLGAILSIPDLAWGAEQDIPGTVKVTLRRIRRWIPGLHRRSISPIFASLSPSNNTAFTPPIPVMYVALTFLTVCII